VAGARPPRGAGPWRRWRGCSRHTGGSVAAAAVAFAAGGSRRCRSRHWRKHRPAAGKHGNKGGEWQQQWVTGTESAERRGNCAASSATPGMGGVGTRFLRTGCTVLWKVSLNLVGSEFTIPRPFPFVVHGGTVAAPVAGHKYRQVAEKGELNVKTRYSCSTSTPVLDLIHAPRQGCPNASGQKSQKHLAERTGELACAC